MIELKPIKESTEDYDQIEKRLKELFKRELYFPLLKELNFKQAILNASADEYESLLAALQSGRVTFSQGKFQGKFNSKISKLMTEFGAKWDKKSSSWKITQAELPREVRMAISASEYRFLEKLSKIDQTLAQILPEKIADKIKIEDLFDRAIWKVERDFNASVKVLNLTPTLTKEQSNRIAKEWQNNMKLWIKDFAREEIVKLRKDMQKAVFAGNRYESAVKTIQASYGVSANKAKFLARQETSLLMTKFKETRYTDAGVYEYKWGCVAGSKNHPVRPAHKLLEGKIFRWDNPPRTTAPGDPVRRNNPGQDYNCRCFAKPIVRFGNK